MAVSPSNPCPCNPHTVAIHSWGSKKVHLYLRSFQMSPRLYDITIIIIITIIIAIFNILNPRPLTLNPLSVFLCVLRVLCIFWALNPTLLTLLSPIPIIPKPNTLNSWRVVFYMGSRPFRRRYSPFLIIIVLHEEEVQPPKSLKPKS